MGGNGEHEFGALGFLGTGMPKVGKGDVRFTKAVWGDPYSGFRFEHGLLEHSDFKAQAERYRA